MNTPTPTQEWRRHTARVLSRARVNELTALWEKWQNPPEIVPIRAPETGLVMVQGRIGGNGNRFHLGEATVTRATMMIYHGATETTGTAYVLGSDHEHAELAAIFDAMLMSSLRDRVWREVIEPLQRRQSSDDTERAAQNRSTVVEFFTTARENSVAEDEDAE